MIDPWVFISTKQWWPWATRQTKFICKKGEKPKMSEKLEGCYVLVIHLVQSSLVLVHSFGIWATYSDYNFENIQWLKIDLCVWESEFYSKPRPNVMKKPFLYFYQMFSTSVKFPCLNIYKWFALADGEQSTSSEQGQTTSQASAPPAGKHYKMIQNQKESFLHWVGFYDQC